MFKLFNKKVVSESEAYRIEKEKKERQGMSQSNPNNTYETMMESRNATVSSEFRMTIEDVLSIAGRGTVVTGKVESGSISVGDVVNLMGQSGVRMVTIAGVEMFRKIIDHASAGDNVGLLLKGVERQDCRSGDTLKKI